MPTPQRRPINYQQCRRTRQTELAECRSLQGRKNVDCVRQAQINFTQCTKPPETVPVHQPKHKYEVPHVVRRPVSCRALANTLANQQKKCDNIKHMCARKPHNKSASCRSGLALDNCTAKLTQLEAAAENCRG